MAGVVEGSAVRKLDTRPELTRGPCSSLERCSVSIDLFLKTVAFRKCQAPTIRGYKLRATHLLRHSSHRTARDRS
ncbi:hypothetical protein X777_03177 [Ooceraea biroi]|uniref:Uncharacterized protein n=1 Tax=Ooceraea biroi TaxID=2015173 RepID=A0A026WM00_OOCBI|nr:hypothetical protein X777_03177 [Ooceraea biroi]